MASEHETNREDGAARGGLRILLADDEPMMREVLARMLAILGHRTSTVANGREAVEHYECHASCIDLVILDSAMPIMDGPQCFRALRKLNPDVRILVSTATPFTEEDLARLYGGISGFIRKPYGLAELSEAVSKAAR